jgi:hypothetical protein
MRGEIKVAETLATPKQPPAARRDRRTAGVDASVLTCAQDAAGEAAGLAIAGLVSAPGLVAGLASMPAAGLASVDAADSGVAGVVSSDLLHAVAAKNIDTRARIRTLRITSSFVPSALAKRAKI